MRKCAFNFVLKNVAIGVARITGQQRCKRGIMPTQNLAWQTNLLHVPVQSQHQFGSDGVNLAVAPSARLDHGESRSHDRQSERTYGVDVTHTTPSRLSYLPWHAADVVGH